MHRREELTISVERFIGRIALFEYHGERAAANALRELAAWFEPPFRINEADVQAQIEALRQYNAKPPPLD